MNTRRPQVDLESLIGATLTDNERDETSDSEAKDSPPATDTLPQERDRREPHGHGSPPPAGGSDAAGVMERIAQPKQPIQRRQLNVGLPAAADLHARLTRYRLDTGLDVQDIVALLLHEGLSERGY